MLLSLYCTTDFCFSDMWLLCLLGHFFLLFFFPSLACSRHRVSFYIGELINWNTILKFIFLGWPSSIVSTAHSKSQVTVDISRWNLSRTESGSQSQIASFLPVFSHSISDGQFLLTIQALGSSLFYLFPLFFPFQIFSKSWNRSRIWPLFTTATIMGLTCIHIPWLQ